MLANLGAAFHGGFSLSFAIATIAGSEDQQIHALHNVATAAIDAARAYAEAVRVSARTRSVPARRVRRIERWLVGVAFGMIAFVLERVVMRSVRRDGKEPPAADPKPRTITSRGGDVDVG